MTKAPATGACRRNISRLFRLTLILVLTCATARAHDPSDITAQARLLPGGMELRLTLAWSTATRLLATSRPPEAIQLERFEEIRPALQLCAPGFLTVTSDGKILAPKSVVAELSRDGDVKIHLQFPPVAAPRFRFDAALLKTLPYGYTVFLSVLGPGPKQYVQERMTSEKPSCEIDVFPH